MSTDDSTADSMRKATEGLDHAAGSAPSADYLDKFGLSDETLEDENDGECATSEDEASAKDTPSSDC